MVLGALDTRTASVPVKQSGFAVNAPFDCEWVIGPGVSAFPVFDVILQLETPLVFNRCAGFDVEPRLRPGRLKRENGSQPFADEIALNPSDGLEHDPEKLADFSDKIMRPNKEKESAIEST